MYVVAHLPFTTVHSTYRFRTQLRTFQQIYQTRRVSYAILVVISTWALIEFAVCGACREGRLIPQFTTNPRVPKTPKMSRMAATKAQGMNELYAQPQPPDRAPTDSPFTPTMGGPLSTPSTPAVGKVICISSGSESVLAPLSTSQKFLTA